MYNTMIIVDLLLLSIFVYYYSQLRVLQFRISYSIIIAPLLAFNGMVIMCANCWIIEQVISLQLQ